MAVDAHAALCFVKDVLEMRDSGNRDMEYFWLERIPCRTVELVGELVGIQVYEQRIVYTLDDGSAVIDYRLHPPPRKPGASGPKAGRARHPSGMGSTSSPHKGPQPSSSKARSAPPPAPKSVAEIGTPVRVTGRVIETAKGRHVLVDEICASVCLAKRRAQSLAAFSSSTVPATPRQTSGRLSCLLLKKRAPPSWVPRSPDKDKGEARAMNVPATPEKGSGDVEPRTPSTSGMASTDGSPASGTSRRSLRQVCLTTTVRLRHPTRLHRRDLTANTFRIYVKHYMDDAPPPGGTHESDADSAASSRAASPTPAGRRQPLALATPRKPTYGGGDGANDKTPRASQLRARWHEIERGMAMATPRAGKAPVRPRSPELVTDEDGVNRRYGFTLSHLRRVPELAVLARRVVNEEGRRRAREELERGQQKSSKAAPKANARPTEPRAKKIKRLFQLAIRQLYDAGSIVLWDGPVRPLPRSQLSLAYPLWKADTSAVSTASAISIDANDPGELSDPSPIEEAYLPLTPAVLAKILERTIREWIAAAAARRQRQQHHGRRADADPSAPLAPLAPPPGPTPAEIVAWLHRDARWAQVGEWAVKDALEWGKAVGRIWCIGQGRWELCG
ncbi:hypothetical protein C8Q72DRAFT_883883 [Fomitopsis betulina]|nr:hypothetical protein C8Q72DRAFT_883883 [Fomitopsis betulina]